MDAPNKVLFSYINDKEITCFVVAGEPWIFVPHLMNMVKNDGVTEEEVITICRDLNIFFKKCSKEQLITLNNCKESLQCSEKYDELITKSDAERLIGSVLQIKSYTQPQIYRGTGLKICHDCFGGCRGIFVSELYNTPTSPCIECAECHVVLSASQFVAHSHNKQETSVKHWGFNSSRWRTYVFIASVFSMEQDIIKLDEMKKKFLPKKVPSDQPFMEHALKMVETRNVVQTIFNNTFSRGKLDPPPHLCTDEPILSDSFIKKHKFSMEDMNYIPNVSLALFNHSEVLSAEARKRKMKHPSQIKFRTMQNFLKDYYTSDSSLNYGFEQKISFQKLCEPDFISKLIGAKKKLFKTLILTTDVLNKKEIGNHFDLMQKHGTDLVYFLLEKRADFLKKLKPLQLYEQDPDNQSDDAMTEIYTQS